jgi:ketosteroid isomerase-like protein
MKGYINMLQSDETSGLTERDLRDYFAAFNSNNFEKFSQYYADNLVFEGRGRHFKNRDEMVNFYRKVKSRIHEIVALKEVVVGSNEMAVEIETELVAFEDWLDMPTGPMRKGDRIRSQNFVWYEIKDRKFVHIRSARYRRMEDREPSSAEKPFDQSSESLPPSMTKEQFNAYINAFNNKNYSAFGDYYNNDVVLVIAGEKELRGRQKIFDFYKEANAQTERTIQINKIITSGDMLAAELQSEFIATKDVPDFIAGPMKKGGRIFINTFVYYNIHNGRFSRIRSAEFRKIVRP